MISYLIYISEAHPEFTLADLNIILEKSKTNNSGLDVTGMLLYVKRDHHDWKGGRFIQLLEGPAASVKGIYDKVKDDDRHNNVIILQQGKAESRVFTDWSMGFESVAEENLPEVPGLFMLDGNFLEDISESNKGLRLNYLKSFYEIGTEEPGLEDDNK